MNVAQRENDNVLAAEDGNDLADAVGIARVVDEARLVALGGGVDHFKLVDAEHVAGDAARVVVPLALVAQRVAYDLAGVLDDHLALGNVDEREEAAALDVRALDDEAVAAELLQVAELDRVARVGGV